MLEFSSFIATYYKLGHNSNPNSYKTIMIEQSFEEIYAMVLDMFLSKETKWGKFIAKQALEETTRLLFTSSLVKVSLKKLGNNPLRSFVVLWTFQRLSILCLNTL